MSNGTNYSVIDRDRMYPNISMIMQERMGVTNESQRPFFKTVLEIQEDMRRNGPNLDHVQKLKDIAIETDLEYAHSRMNVSAVLEIGAIPESEGRRLMNYVVGFSNARNFSLLVLTKALVDPKTDGQTQNQIIAALKELALEERGEIFTQGSPKYYQMKEEIGGLITGLIKNTLTQDSHFGEVIPAPNKKTAKKALSVLTVAGPGSLGQFMLDTKASKSIRMASVYRLQTIATDPSYAVEPEVALTFMTALAPQVHGCDGCKNCAPVEGALRVAIEKGTASFISKTTDVSKLESTATDPAIPVTVRMQAVGKLGEIATSKSIHAMEAFNSLDSVNMLARKGKPNEDSTVRQAAQAKLQEASRVNGIETKTRQAIRIMERNSPHQRQPVTNKNRDRPMGRRW